MEPISLDEAFLDVEGSRRLHGTGPEIATAIRARVRADTGLTVSIGVATTKLLAKLSSDLAKPDGLLVVEPGTELDVLHPLAVRRLWGVGPATERKLTALGVQTVGELAALPEGAIAGGRDLVNEVAVHGVRLPIPTGGTLELWPVTRSGRDGPLVVGYRVRATP